MEFFAELSKLFESEDADVFKPKPKSHYSYVSMVAYQVMMRMILKKPC